MTKKVIKIVTISLCVTVLICSLSLLVFLTALQKSDGYVRYDTMTIVLAVVILIVMVQLIQWIFNLIVWKIDKKNKA